MSKITPGQAKNAGGGGLTPIFGWYIEYCFNLNSQTLIGI